MWNCIVEDDWKKIFNITYIKIYIIFDNSLLKNFTVKYIYLEVVMKLVMNDLPGCFSKSVWVRIKYIEKFCINLWDIIIYSKTTYKYSNQQKH